ncbi:hypothetical protein ASPVEDRAFT_148058 [Aspergillus versicolor CBS 583.65]|uniref:BD-FAE-like domain-containing protein n=1 Tax=Aspergillus versicolor CBS 583.65 TaxID=1036611 RepID=A0A1L9PBP1_ASPVE|nr:uncharacterized protein ASPVEDRAFT_148058 [Aspergillus versicolor CBS 583.65]OJI98892.1 hypothetical protein ASPVEDRAFT_148058 [Aspergillus versicolor CBS 583.65]
MHDSANAEQDPAAVAIRGKEITGPDIFQKSNDETSAVPPPELISEMFSDIPNGGTDMSYGEKDSQRLRFWKGISSNAPIIVFVHGGGWRVGTYLDSVGSTKVSHLTSKGYSFASVNYTLVPTVAVEEQVQEVADSIGYLVNNAVSLNIDPGRLVLMGHSSGAHVVTLLGTDSSYVERAGVSLDAIRGIIALDGSYYNAPAEILDSPGPVAENMIYALGSDPERLKAMSPTYHARGPNAEAFLLLHVHRQGDIRQAMELEAALKAAGTSAAVHVFEGQGFHGHVRMLLRLGDVDYPATVVMDNWLREHVPIS